VAVFATSANALQLSPIKDLHRLHRLGMICSYSPGYFFPELTGSSPESNSRVAGEP
jgi:hypothetical protein